MTNVNVSQAWVKNASRLIAQVRSLLEAARDERRIPDWLQERLKIMEKLLEEL